METEQYYYYYKDGSDGTVKVDSNGKGWRVMKQHILRVPTLSAWRHWW